MIKDGERIICVEPSLPILRVLGKKYSVLILGVIGNEAGKRNFNEILRDVPGSSSTIVSKRLKELQDSGLVRRIDNGTVTYELTDLGKRIRKVLLPFFSLIEGEGSGHSRTNL
ncbi:MAG: helix-turn-helix domain-containing protein [Thermoplasmataceae archaeon]